MSKAKSQIEKDIAFCIDECEMNYEQVADMLRWCERLGNIAVEYFCEEFVFMSDDQEEFDRVHDENYLSIADFNAMYWEGN